jgi:hypothetical protein
VSARSVGDRGRAVTEAVAQERSLSLEQAERWKHERGVAEPGVRRAVPARGRGARALANEIRASRHALESSCRRDRRDRAWSAAARTSSTDRTLARRAHRLPTERLGPARARLGPRPRDGRSRRSCSRPALALALRGSARATRA